MGEVQLNCKEERDTALLTGKNMMVLELSFG